MRLSLLTVLILAAIPAAALAQDSIPKNHGKEVLAIPPVGSVDAGGQPPHEAAADLAATDATLAPLMARIEAAVAMPPRARPLGDYARFYAWADKNRGKVTAVFLAQGAPGRKWVGFDDLPMVLDGGCGVVSLVFDLSSGKVDEIGCNGDG